MIHEDERRILEDWPEAKVITAKKDCDLGGHYHKIKTEKFILGGGIISYQINDEAWKVLEHGVMLTISPNQWHRFYMASGSVLIGICSHPYDPTDDYRD